MTRSGVESSTYRGTKPKRAIGAYDTDPKITQRFKAFGCAVGGRVVDYKNVCPSTPREEHRSA
jgi:hypothetical protein